MAWTIATHLLAFGLGTVVGFTLFYTASRGQDC
jgi:hypothetical protein